MLALVMSALGLYGVVAYDVARHGRELGLRIALAAPVITLITALRDD